MIIGIDLGTTNSLVSYYEDGEWNLIKNEFGSTKTPSVISFDEDGLYYVGEIAERRKMTHSKSTYSLFKREIGNGRKKTFGNYSAVDLSALMIKYLVELAEKILSCKVDEAVISVPAYFDDMQRQETKLAGELAGIKVERIVNEPSAAALAYYIKKPENGYNLIFDFGGGTLDVSVVDIFDEVIDIISIGGNTNLGGLDIDRKIVSHFISQFSQLKTLNSDDKRALHVLAESVKIELTSKQSSVLKYVYEDIEYEFEYNNQILTDICTDILFEIRDTIEIVLTDANLSTSDLENLICIGGSSYVRFIRQYLKMLIGLDPKIDINPEEVVAIGVGIVASIKERRESVKDILLMDVCPFALGIEIIDGAFGIIIPKNSSLPITRTQVFYTTADNQQTINISVFQGDSLLVKNNKPIGSKQKIKVPRMPAGEAQINVTFTYDINGILNANVESDIETKDFVIITNKYLDDNAIKEQQIKISKLLKKEVVNPEVERYLASIEAIHRNSRLEQQEEIKELITNYNKALESGKSTVISRSVEEIKEYVEKNSYSVFDREVPAFKN